MTSHPNEEEDIALSMDTARADLTIGDTLRQLARTRPGEHFIRCDDVTYTYEELDQRADAVAAGFARLGVRKGDRVAIMSPNRIEVVELYFGLARLGAVQAPLNVYLKGEFLRYQIVDSECSVAVVDRDGRGSLESLTDDLPALRTVVNLDGVDDGPPTTNVTEVAYSAVCQPATPATPLSRTEVGRADLMSILYTSGTTGYPKGCMLSHGYTTRVGDCVADVLELKPTDSIYSALPLFHAGAALLVLATAVRLGVPVTIDSVFSARNIIPRCKEVGATVIIGLGAMGVAMLATPEGPQDRDHQVHTMWLVPMTPEHQERFAARYGIDPWTEAFGQTECVPLLATPRSTGRERSSCGRPTPDLEVALLDDDDEPVAPGEVGEVCVRPLERYAIFDGYWRKPETTLEQFRSLWYHTGDNARMLPSGAYTFVDRKKDSMRRRGENVSSIELEQALLKHPKIAEVAVHAVPSELAEDDIKACVVLAQGQSIDPAELFDFFRENLPYYAIPRYVEIVTDLPRNAVGRVMKHKLRERPLTEDVSDLHKLGFVVAKSDRRRQGTPT